MAEWGSIPKNVKRKRRFIKYFLLSFIVLFLVIFGGIFFILFGYWQSTPKLSTVFKDPNSKVVESAVDIKYTDRNGTLFYETNKFKYVPITDKEVVASKNLQNALLSIEDRDFYREGGVNYKRTVKSAFDSLIGKNLAGGSTITQQLIKLTFYSTKASDQTIKRKVQEIRLAEELNDKYSKTNILKWYLNKTYYGNAQQGIKQASKYYYDTVPEKLSIDQAALLVGLVNNPTLFNPYINPENAKNRRNTVLYAMYDNGKISKKEYDKLSKIPITSKLVYYKKHVVDRIDDRHDKLKYNGYVSAVNAQLNRYDKDVLSKSMTIKTSMDKEVQDKVNEIVDSYHFPDDKFEEAIVVLDNQTGEVVGMSGGRFNTVLGGYNRAFNVSRSSGSTIKPILDYGPVMELYKWNQNKIVDDKEMVYPGTNVKVTNWDGKYQGKITMKDALIRSRNVPAINALITTTLPKAKQALVASGLNADGLYFSSALGVNTSPLNLASAYSALANNGIRVSPRFILELESGKNKLLTEKMENRVFSPQTSYFLTSMLKDVFTEKGTAPNAKIDDISQAGKTGSVGIEDQDNYKNGTSDIWMAGYTKKYTVMVWTGYDDPYNKDRYLKNDQSNIAQDLYKQVMEFLKDRSDFDKSDWEAPDGLTKAGNEYVYSNNIDLSDNFTKLDNRQNTYVPFKVKGDIKYFLGNDNEEQLLKKVNEQ